MRLFNFIKEIHNKSFVLYKRKLKSNEFGVTFQRYYSGHLNIEDIKVQGDFKGLRT